MEITNMFCLHIPLEIQREIIKRIPDIKPLLRFRSVSKPWKSFIDSREFIAFYGVRHTHPNRLLLRYQLTGYISRKQLQYDFFIDDASFPLQEEYLPRRIPQLVYQHRDSDVIGSSCGLWCFHDYDTKMVVIWNLSTRRVVRIVDPCVHKNTFRRISRFGFGVCPSTYDPTIVGIYNDIGEWQVHIFTLSSKTWRMIPSSKLPRKSVELNYLTQVVIDRFIFWGAFDRIVANKKQVLEDLILSFDLITHEFKEIRLPDSITNHEFKEISIAELNESLVVSACTTEVNNGRVYGVWMMGEEEGGVMPSFTKLFNIKTTASKMILLGFRKSGQPIMETWKKDKESDDESDKESDDESDKESDDESDKESDDESDEESDDESDEEFAALEVYDPCLEETNVIDIIKGEKESLFICPYKETLLLADHSDGCIISSDY